MNCCGNAVPLDHAAHRAAVLQERHFKCSFGAFAGAAEQNTCAGRHQGVHRFAEHRGQRGCLKGIARAQTGDFPDLRHHVSAVWHD